MGDQANTKPGGLTLYAHLLGKNNAGATLSSAPVLYSKDEAQQKQEEKKKANPALLFQPTKRPQVAPQKAKAKAHFPKPPASWQTASSSSPDPAVKAEAQAKNVAPAVKTSLADWTADDDDFNGFYGGEKRERGGRRKKKKKVEREVKETDWNEIYDPLNPTVYSDFRNSDERFRMKAAWYDRLHAHRRAPRQSSDLSDSGHDDRPMNSRFAPPSSYLFAPPASLNAPDDMSPPPPPPADTPDAPTGEDAYAQRMRLTQAAQDQPVLSPPPPPPPPPTGETTQPPKEPTAVVFKSGATISAAPVLYNIPRSSSDAPASEVEMEDAPVEPSKGPTDTKPEENQGKEKKKGGGFGLRLMEKMGYTKGKGLGADEDGIVKALSVVPEKRKKLSDAEGGGFADRGGRGKIVGGNKAKGTVEAEGKYGQLSDVIIVWGLVDGVDLEAEKYSNGPGIREKIGDDFGAKYGTIERIIINENSEEENIPVLIKFTSQLSALRAQQALAADDFTFYGSPVRVRFYDSDRFNNGIYE